LPVGYVKCPRCHNELSSPIQISRGRQRTDGGGTAIGESGNRTAIVIGAGVAIGALVIWLVVRDPASSTAAPVAADAAAAALPDEPVADEPVADEPVAPSGRPAPPPPDDDRPNPTAALSQLSRDLRVEKLWAAVGQDGDTIVIDSSFCEDTALGGILDSHAGELRAARFAAVRCRAPHGGVVFERGL
jgi:hypothetical protein